MSTYLVGDIHGCYEEFVSLLEKIFFDPKKDILWLTGDLVSRGTSSLEVLRLIYKLKKSIKIVLGNHDLFFIKIFSDFNICKIKNNIPNYMIKLLVAQDIEKLINWLRCQPLLQIDENKKLIMVHAGIFPQWNIKTAILCSKYFEKILSNKNYHFFLKKIIEDNNLTIQWSNELSSIERIKFISNVFTKIRYCYPNGQMEMTCKMNPKKAPYPLIPWFNINGLIPKNYNIVFGHWSSLIEYITPPGIYCLDTGCCWGGKLTILRWEDKKFFYINCNRLSS